MRYEKEFDAPMTSTEAITRASYVLTKWRYLSTPSPQGARYERSFPLAGLVVVHPHHVHTKIHLTVNDLPQGGCHVHISQEVFKYGQPSSILDKIVWRGDVDDVEASLTKRQDPSMDRVRQNNYAGTVTIKFILAVVLPPIVAAGWLAVTGNTTGSLFCLALLVVAAIALPFLPFQMPLFALENNLPPSPVGTNYPRSGEVS